MSMLSRILLLASLAAGLAGPVKATAIASGVPRPATVGELSLMMEALEKTARELPRWAYTETRVMRDDDGKVKRSSVVRYDPSQPYTEQWTPITVNGKAPTERDRERYRRWGDRAQRRDEKAERAPRAEGEVVVNRDGGRQVTLGEVMETHAATVVASDATHLTYEIPLRKDRNDRFPPEKFQVLARIAREARSLETISVRLRSSFRTKLVVKVKAGEGTLDFTTVDPKYAPTLTRIRGDASASILFVSVGGELELTRTELRQVKPYNERFEVQIGTLQAIDF